MHICTCPLSSSLSFINGTSTSTCREVFLYESGRRSVKVEPSPSPEEFTFREPPCRSAICFDTACDKVVLKKKQHVLPTVKAHEALTEQSETGAASLLQFTRVELDDPVE